MKSLKSLIIIAIGLSVLTTLTSCKKYKKLSEWKEKYDDLMVKHNELEQQFKNLESKYDDLKQDVKEEEEAIRRIYTED